ncbi:TIGR02444 family protein [Aliidiomarina minuta]|uniref:TIGR02444 family protein n=1 Tax=Aliidiomarina minuta TaxID=880057 RepID=A0A432W9G9_9GAMM|nr:TIGR02444 family protein [Aliidiomarina minuta]RUO26742.1 TIGR02444 family protein [Aliidiomarina minuta]
MAGIERRTGKLKRSELTTADFWDAAAQLYAEPQVQKCCLQAQDKQGINVNLLLFMMWLEKQSKMLSLSHYDQLKAALESFNKQFTAPLRNQRRRLSEHPQLSVKSRQQLKEKLLAAELILEAEEQALMIARYHELPEDNTAPISWHSVIS